MLTLIAVALVTLVAFGIVTRDWLAKTALAKKPTLVAAPGQSTAPRIEAELITLTPHGFEPVEITRPTGRFLLAVDNRSGVLDTTLRLDRETGDRLHEVRLPRGKLGWRNRAELPPGRYVLTEASHPAWTCRLTITAR